MINRYFYQADVATFLAEDTDTIFGKMSRADEMNTAATQKFAWPEKRENLLKDYTVINGDKLELESDKTFPSPSTAADFCIGSSNNGWLVWKDKNGQTLDAVYRKQLEE